jgi:HPt (histidine-containing phosphotransfer) domain-containing protein
MGFLNTMNVIHPLSIDPQSIADLRALNPDDPNFLRELIELFLQDVPQRLQDLEQALARGDAPTLARAAHTIKGSSSNFGAARLCKLAQEIESEGKSGNLAAVGGGITELRAEFSRVTEALNSISKVG